MKTACIYHSIDLDGWMSAAIVKHWFIDKSKFIVGKELDFIGYNYGQPIPDLSEYDKIIMCDISFSKEELLKLNTPNDRLIWIDHHASILKEFYENFDTIEATNKFFKGLRSSKFAACELTWKYLFPNESMPEIVRLLGRYDCFGHKGTDEETKVLEFQYGARQCISNYEEAYEKLMNNIHYDRAIDKENLKDERIEIWNSGIAIYQYLCTEAKQAYKNGFKIVLPETIVEKGTVKNTFIDRKFICINKERFNPINFGIDYHSEGYDGAMCWHLGADKMVNISFYNDNGQVDCSVIAKSFGGGGHKGAAGCRMTLDLFNEL